MFTKSIWPGDWVKDETGFWWFVAESLDGTLFGFQMWNGQICSGQAKKLYREFITQRIGDRPLANLGNMFGLPHMKPCHTCGGNGFLWEVPRA